MPYRYRVLPGGRRVAETRVTAATLAGTAAEVLAAVGSDSAAARRYLDAEQASESPRSTLIAKLERIAGDA